MTAIREAALLKPLVEQFLTYCRACNHSANTIRAYQGDWACFLALIGPDATTAQISHKLFRKLAVALYESGAKTTTMCRKLAALKVFVRWLERENFVAQGLSDLVLHPRIPNYLPDVPSEAEVSRLLDGEFKTPCPERDRLVLELLYCGLRADEVVGINLDDFSDPDLLLVRGKGRKERLVFVGELGRLALMEWLPVRKILLHKRRIDTTALLFSVSPGALERLQVRSVGRIVKGVAKAHGLDPKKWHPHLLRHACATHMHDNGAPLQSIATMLGHSKLATAQLYTRVSVGRMMKTYKAAHPHASTTS